jgi:hypothetical protein
MSWCYLALVPLLIFKIACMPVGRVQRAVLGGMTWLVRLFALAWLSLLSVLVLAPQWFPLDAAGSLDLVLGLPSSDSPEPWRVLLLLSYGALAALIAVPLLILLDLLRSLGEFESKCRTLTDLMRYTVRLAENAHPSPSEHESKATPKKDAASQPSNNRLRPLSEMLG